MKSAEMPWRAEVDGFAYRDFDFRRLQPGGRSELIAQNSAELSLATPVKTRPRILLVDEALARHESHASFLRPIPAIIEAVAPCLDMYLHEGDGYSLVILILQPRSRETAEAARFVRRRWSSARILLLESESAEIDDWLYDERVDPDKRPAAMRAAALRLLNGRDTNTPRILRIDQLL